MKMRVLLKSACVACGFAAIGSVIASSSLPWPSMAIEPNEPPQLAKYHATRPGLGYFCFMPKNQEEMDMLYGQYKAGNFLPDSRDPFVKKGAWDHVLLDIDGELSNRLKIGDMKLIDKYLNYLQVFADLVSKHPDRGFIGKRLFGEFGLSKVLADCAQYAASISGVTGKRHLNSKDIPHVVAKLNVIANSADSSMKDNVLHRGMFELQWQVFSDTKEGKAQTQKMVDEVAGMLTSEGLPL